MNFNEHNSEPREQAPAKSHPARLVAIYDIGVQEGGMYEGKKQNNARKIIMAWELLGKDKDSNGKNFIVSEFLTFSLNVNATFPKRLLSMGIKLTKKNDKWYNAPENFIISSLLGEAMIVSTFLSETGKAKIDSISMPVEGMTIQENTEKLFFLDLDADDYLDQFNAAPKWVQNFVTKSIGWAPM